jgi:hypothetical protein
MGQVTFLLLLKLPDSFASPVEIPLHVFDGGQARFVVHGDATLAPGSPG